jgi:hypothetical protein
MVQRSRRTPREYLAVSDARETNELALWTRAHSRIDPQYPAAGRKSRLGGLVSGRAFGRKNLLQKFHDRVFKE